MMTTTISLGKNGLLVRKTRFPTAAHNKAMVRLNRRFNRLLEKGKPKPLVAVAIARELTGFVWAAMRLRAQ
jgi:hypothetical protein